jgi:hypothetical protein
MPRSFARFHPSTSAIYSADDLGHRRYDVSTAPVAFERDLRDFRCPGMLWFSEDESLVFNRCGDVLQVSDNPDLDLVRLGDLTEFGLTWVTESLEAGRIATVSGQLIEYHDGATFARQEVATIPDVLLGGEFHESTGRFGAYSADGSQLFVIVDAGVSYALLGLDP